MECVTKIQPLCVLILQIYSSPKNNSELSQFELAAGQQAIRMTLERESAVEKSQHAHKLAPEYTAALAYVSQFVNKRKCQSNAKELIWCAGGPAAAARRSISNLHAEVL
jgi:hypothetical protein